MAFSLIFATKKLSTMTMGRDIEITSGRIFFSFIKV